MKGNQLLSEEQMEILATQIRDIVNSAIQATIPAIVAIVMSQLKTANAKNISPAISEVENLLTNQDITGIFRHLIASYNKMSDQLRYDNFKIQNDEIKALVIKSKFAEADFAKIMLYFVGSNLSSTFDPYNNTPLTRLVANQRFGLIKAIIDVVGDQELLKANPALTKRFLDSSDKNGINFLEMSSRFYGVMSKQLLEKVISLYAENAEPDSIKLTPAILSLPKDLFDLLLPKIDKASKKEFADSEFGKKFADSEFGEKFYAEIVRSRKDVGLSPLAVYVENGYEDSVVVNYSPKSDGLPDQISRGNAVTGDKKFEYPGVRSGTIASRTLAKRGEDVIRENFDRPDLTSADQEAIISALIAKNPNAAKMAEQNAKLNIQNLLQSKEVCSSDISKAQASQLDKDHNRIGRS